MTVGVALLAGLVPLSALANLSVETWLRFLAWLAVGMVVYLGYGRRRNRLARREREQQREQETERSEVGGPAVADPG